MSIKTYTIAASDGISQMHFAPEKGGLAYSLIMPDQGKPRELLYQPEDFSLASYDSIHMGWPFCFPICARLSRDGQYGGYNYNHHRYELPIHGFANDESWQVNQLADHRLILTLTDNERTRSVYPFEFEVILDYHLQPGKLTCHQHYHNTGNTIMPYYAGFHPYFLIDLERYRKEHVKVDFAGKQQLIYNDELTDIVGTKPAFKTPISIAAEEVNESLTQLEHDHRITLSFPDGFTITMQVDSPDDATLFDHVQLYHIPKAPFFCIEPWMATPNSLNTVDQARLLAPGQSEQACLVLSV